MTGGGVAGRPQPHVRDPYRDFVKGSLMSLVVLGHFAQAYLEKVGGGGRSRRLRRSSA